jgi:cytosine/adenosine deaminase-related metal-dependent hydrolase
VASSNDERTFSARWIFPVEGPPLPGGTLSFRGGRISAVLEKGQRTPDEDFGNAAILPGLVNAHTHLDLTGLRGQCPPAADFTVWLRAVIAGRRSRTQQQVEADIRAGIAESLSQGVTLVGDIASCGWSWPILDCGPLRATAFFEVLGLPAPRAEAALQAATAWLQSLPVSKHCRPGLSPHAPYSVRRDLFADCARLGVPLAVHLAETRAELQLLATHDGPFRPFLEELGVWDPSGLARSVDDVIVCCGPAPRRLFVHANYLDPATLMPSGSTIVYCPRTHAAFGHDEHPVRALLQRGVPIALGTDSLASNPDLSVLAEARFVRARYPDVAGDELLRMITLYGAAALGWEDETGSLSPGKSADFVVVPLPDDDDDPEKLLFESTASAARVFIRGREL